MIILEVIMICVATYVVVSFLTFGLMLVSYDSKTKNVHPEMKEVRPTDPLLVVSFNGPLRTRDAQQSPDSRFTEFYVDYTANNGNNDGT